MPRVCVECKHAKDHFQTIFWRIKLHPQAFINLTLPSFSNPNQLSGVVEETKRTESKVNEEGRAAHSAPIASESTIHANEKRASTSIPDLPVEAATSRKQQATRN